MKHSASFLLIGIYAVGLSSCAPYQSNYIPGQVYVYDNSQLYPRAYNFPSDYGYRYDRPVSVPNSYHVGAYHSPVSFRDRDKTWVSQQNPQGYTIEVADDAKASYVAKRLYKAPKSDRMAQVRYQHNGKTYYKGVYGSYNNLEEAQQAFDALPDEVKAGAGVKNWGSVQGNLEE